MKNFNYKVVRSSRKTICLEVTAIGIIVRTPFCVTNQQIDEFVFQHKDWIEKHLLNIQQQQIEVNNLPKLTIEEIQELADKALKYIPSRVEYYASKIGVTYRAITIRNQKSRWGSCSAKGNLNFNCLLMLTPLDVIDSVIVHELCHRKEMNHSDKFYADVLNAFPDYWKCDKWLKENGKLLILRMTK